MKDIYARISTLTEREKELKCLYNVDKCLTGNDLHRILKNIAAALPAGWQYPDICSVEIHCYDIRVRSPRFEVSGNKMSSDIRNDGEVFGNITIYYPAVIKEIKPEFLPEEQLLLNAIVRHISMFLSLPLSPVVQSDQNEESHWEWRLRMVHEICNYCDFTELKISEIYVAGSTKNATSGPASDIDLIIIHNADDVSAINEYFKGWSHSLAVWNESRTGIHQKSGLLDVHLIHEKSLASGNSWVTMLSSTENSAKLIRSVK